MKPNKILVFLSRLINRHYTKICPNCNGFMIEMVKNKEWHCECGTKLIKCAGTGNRKLGYYGER